MITTKSNQLIRWWERKGLIAMLIIAVGVAIFMGLFLFVGWVTYQQTLPR
jgi:hypothetical protein